MRLKLVAELFAKALIEVHGLRLFSYQLRYFADILEYFLGKINVAFRFKRQFEAPIERSFPKPLDNPMLGVVLVTACSLSGTVQLCLPGRNCLLQFVTMPALHGDLCRGYQ